MKYRRLKPTLLLLVLALTGCKVELYSGLSQQDANQMIVLLTGSDISADKVQDKDGTLTLQVEKNDFVNAVNVLHQYGFPKRKYQSVNDVFPSGQLVTSPAEEAVKIDYLKEQNLEKMLADIDGVISAHVSIAQAPGDNDSTTPVASSASVFIKYSPNVNLDGFVTQIKSLVHNSIPDLNYDAISVVLQPAQILLLKNPAAGKVQQGRRGFIPTWLAITLGLALVWCAVLFMLIRRQRNRNKQDIPDEVQ